ncbi:MAG TPA: LysR substrate-binding domain-containing protein [Burkholderiaceae bacterium]|nr:LysR substrate-binding domain-containing protein [Burkholderiaceae bacterium]
MPKHFPKLHALRAFEATARLLSFTKAGRELHLTQTAISHQIKELETLLETQLFDRRNNAITLTHSGLDYLRQIRPALAMIGTATDEVSSTRKARLHIACLSTFAAKCLLPALPDFRKRHRDIEIRLTPVIGADRIAEQSFDVGIGYGVNTMPNLAVYPLPPDDIFPVCSPALLQGKTMAKPEDLLQHTILRSVSPIVEDDWSAWMAQTCKEPLIFLDEISFKGLFLTVEAALSGLGICMGRSWLIQKELRHGSLVAPFQDKVRLDVNYFLAHDKNDTDVPKIRHFREWALEYFCRERQYAA